MAILGQCNGKLGGPEVKSDGHGQRSSANAMPVQKGLVPFKNFHECAPFGEIWLFCIQ